MAVSVLAVLAKGEEGGRGGDKHRYRLNRHEFEQTLGDREEQESLAHGSPWGHKESDMT